MNIALACLIVIHTNIKYIMIMRMLCAIVSHHLTSNWSTWRILDSWSFNKDLIQKTFTKMIGRLVFALFSLQTLLILIIFLFVIWLMWCVPWAVGGVNLVMQVTMSCIFSIAWWMWIFDHSFHLPNCVVLHGGCNLLVWIKFEFR